MGCSISTQRSRWSTDMPNNLLERSRWSTDIPNDLLELISSKLTNISDYVRFRSVCKSWRSAAIPTNHLCPQVPWLMVPYNTKSPRFSFLNIANKTAYTLDLPEIHGKAIVGSSHGWLVILDLPAMSIFLFNPLTKSRIQLPPATHLPGEIVLHASPSHRKELVIRFQEAGSPVDSYEDIWALFGHTNPYIWRAFLSSSPNSNDCIVTVVVKRTFKFAFCRPGDRAWTVLHTSLPYHIDTVAYHKQQFYIFDVQGNTAICDASPASRPKLIPSLKAPNSHFHSYLYTVNTSGHELLLVALRSRYREDGEVWKLDYSIFKLDQLKWSMVESIGQNTLFLSPLSCGFSISTASNSGFAPNSIYFSAPRDSFEVQVYQFYDDDAIPVVSADGYDIYRSEVHRENFLKDEISDPISHIWKNIPGVWLGEPQWFVPALN